MTQNEQQVNLLCLISETLILILTNQFGSAGKIRELKSVIENLKDRLISIAEANCKEERIEK